MALPRLTIDGPWFRDPSGRRVLLRGVNLGGDTKVPTTPDGRTDKPTDFSDHRTVSFVGRPFPLAEADTHFRRLAHWGFNCLRLLTTWEAVEHAGPGEYDTAYLDYFAQIARKAGEHGFWLFVDFHQDAWSRMSGGDGAPGWTFEAVGLDFTTFHAAGAAHVMQYKYDAAKGGRQDSYPQMTWATNYRMPANAIMWTLFFAGNAFAPAFHIEGQSAQDYLQGRYLGAMRAVAERVADMDHVLGFDTLNEPSLGWIGRSLTEPTTTWPGPIWSPLDGLMVSDGHARAIPLMAFDPETRITDIVRTDDVNADAIRIWRAGAENPFAAAFRDGPREDYFTHVGGRTVEPEADFVAPFFARVAKTIRALRPDWIVFGEKSPFDSFGGGGFPEGSPPNMVNASHWYDIATLTSKSFARRAKDGADAVRRSYVGQLERLKRDGDALPGGGSPTLVGEFGIPFDLDGGAAYEAWAKGDHGDAAWADHIQALTWMYDAMDELLLHATQWNYTASNRNDLAIGDGWNQEDLSIYSADQATSGNDPDSGGRAVAGFARPYVRLWAGRPVSQHFDAGTGVFQAEWAGETDVGPAEIFVPRRVYPGGPSVAIAGDAAAQYDGATQTLRIDIRSEETIVITCRPATSSGSL